jgi:hypothetical protein
MTRALALALVTAACAAPAAPRRTALLPTAATPAPPSDCPDAPAIELQVMSPDGPGEALRVGGHVTSIETLRDDDDHLALVGTLDVKGTLAFEHGTHALALANYAATVRGEGTRRLALTLRGRPLAEMTVSSALRGGRFRIPVRGDLAPPFTDETTEELAAALRVDRRCFPGR